MTNAELVSVLQAVAAWNSNPTLEPGLPQWLEQLVLRALETTSDPSGDQFTPEFICDRCSLRQNSKPKIDPPF